MTGDDRPLKVLVTGGGGFLGRAIVERLIARGDRVRSFSRGDYPALRELGVQVVRGDIVDREAVVAACHGCDVVIHVAARAGLWGCFDDFYRVNVVGTDNVLAGCSAHGIDRLVYTSSPSVVFDGTDMEGVDESVPYARHYRAHYPHTKAIAERMVLEASGPNLAAVALRPHLIWGPRDNHLVPRILARARSLRRIGPTDKMVDCLYIDNAADAHILACDRLAPGSPIAGKAYFISQDEPRGIWTLVDGILGAAGLSPVRGRVPRWLAFGLASGLELGYAALGIRREPRLTRFLVEELSTSHWFDISAARRDLGFRPHVSIDEGLRRLSIWLRGDPAP